MRTFETTRSLIPPPTLEISNIEIPRVQDVKLSAMTWDTKLNWKLHLSQLEAKCNKGLNLMRRLCSHERGADHDELTLMTVYRALIRSKIDYDSIVYDSAATQDLKALETTANEAMRIASGCLKSTPISSLRVVSEEPPLQMRRDQLSRKYYYKIRSSPNNPGFKHITPEQENLYSMKRIPPPFAIKFKQKMEKYQMP